MRAYSRKNGWKLASPDGARCGGIMIGSLVGICGRVFRVVPADDCLDDVRDDDDDDDDGSPALDLDMLKTILC